MGLILFILILFFVFVGGGWLLGKGVGKFLFRGEKETYVDKSVHYHTTVINHNHEHRHISIIDEQTKKDILNLKESKGK